MYTVLMDEGTKNKKLTKKDAIKETKKAEKIKHMQAYQK